MEHPRYSTRTVQWGHWALTFMDIQPDRTCNFGKIVAVLPFAAGACGPVDGTYGSPTRESYKEAVKNWIDRGVLPKAAQRRCGY